MQFMHSGPNYTPVEKTALGVKPSTD